MAECIGIDFDNTVVTYDNVFHKYAVEYGLITGKVKKSKQDVRDAIRALPQGNDKWTVLQGFVYGKHMAEAELIRGVEDFFRACRQKSFKVVIISHKTVYPAMGPRTNLQKAARKWLKDKNFLSKFGLSDKDVIFVETLEEKLDRIAQEKCTYFIDDLKEVLTHSEFPKGVKKILYSRTKNESLSEDVMHFGSWDSIKRYFFE